MSLDINMIDIKEYNWKEMGHEIGVHIKSKHTWHHIIR